jgi:inner membrane protein
MQNELPPPLAAGSPAVPTTTERRNKITIKLLFIAGLVLLLQGPLYLVNTLQKERRANHGEEPPAVTSTSREAIVSRSAPAPASDRFEPYRIVERALKHSPLVLALVFAAFFLFETLASLRLHAVHYGLVGAAMCLFYLALLALGEVLEPGPAYTGAAVASSLLITLYSAAILHSPIRALAIAGLLGCVHGVLYIVLRMEFYALLAGTGALFAALAAVMYFTRNVDWQAQDAAEAAR